jgi:uncharacterized protein (DUF2141 family)
MFTSASKSCGHLSLEALATAARPAVVACLATLVLGSPASATVLYSTFGPGDSFISGANGSFWNIGAFGGIGSKFSTPSSPGFALTSIEAAMIQASGAANTVRIAVYSDNQGAPGSLIDTSSSNVVSGQSIFTFSFSNANLAPSSTYWFRAFVSSSQGGTSGLDFNNQGILGTAFWGFPSPTSFSYDASPGTVSPAFRVNVSAVPEANSMAMLAIGLLCLSYVRRSVSSEHRQVPE